MAQGASAPAPAAPPRGRIGIVSSSESLDDCVPAFTQRASGAVAAALADGTLDLDAPSGLCGVVDGLVPAAACTALIKAAAKGCSFRRKQAAARADSVSWLPLFSPTGDAAFDEAFAPLREALIGVGPAVVAYRRAHGGDDDESLLVPRVAQLALYDGSEAENGGYRAHKDNGDVADATGGRLASDAPDPRNLGTRDAVTGVPRHSQNYRELTAILYLNDPAGASAAGGELRCHCVDEIARRRRVVDVEPTAGRLVLFRSRKLLHEVAPVRGWQRVALTVWLLLPMPRLPVEPPPPPSAPPKTRRRVRVALKKKKAETKAAEAEAAAAAPPAADTIHVFILS